MGRRIIEAWAGSLSLRLKHSKTLRSEWVEAHDGDRNFLLASPDCFMNESGEVVGRLVAHFGIDFKSDLLVVVDDFALSFGTLRLRSSGQDGGHRGLRSIEEVLQSRSYARLRVGIAPVAGGNAGSETAPLEEYVLQPFGPHEEKRLKEIIGLVVEACRAWLTEPIERAMDRTNRPFLPS